MTSERIIAQASVGPTVVTDQGHVRRQRDDVTTSQKRQPRIAWQNSATWRRTSAIEP